ncbi:Global transcription regulator sge1 [Coemansia furcata]|uniref:Global transcription regulator sge1 n=1 Tax=Coemansia furcata TaxID=417177 RepID=A0ACC1L5K3_9FUNG|nr:Global transcription regulator sge1 [Coemansia furcata]
MDINASTVPSGPPLIDPCTVLNKLDMAPGEVIVGGNSACFTVTGLKVTSTRDALMIFEACRRGILPRVIRRLHETEKQLIDAGTVVVFDEREAKMRRWTDGHLWTPSRIVNNFLLYRELDQKIQPGQAGAAEVGRWARAGQGGSFGSRKGVFMPKEHGLIKRTISLSVPDDEAEYLSMGMCRPQRTHQQHLVAYSYTEGEAQLPAPDDMEELQNMRLPLLLLHIQKFRRPVRITVSDDSGDYDMVDTDDEDESDAGNRKNGTRRVYGTVAGADAPGRVQPLTSPLPLSSPVHALVPVNAALGLPTAGTIDAGINPDTYPPMPGAPMFTYDAGRVHPVAPYYNFAGEVAHDVMFGAAGEPVVLGPLYSEGNLPLHVPPPQYMDALYGLQQQHYGLQQQQQHVRVFQEHHGEPSHPQVSHVHRTTNSFSSQK